MDVPGYGAADLEAHGLHQGAIGGPVLPHHLAIGGPVAAQIHAVPYAAHLPTVADLLDAGASVFDLLDAGASVAEILAAGSPVAEILAAGATVFDLLDAWASVDDLLDAGASVAEILASGATLAEILAAGATLADLLADGATLADLLAAGATLADLLFTGASMADLLAAGASKADLLATGASMAGLDLEPGWNIYLHEKTKIHMFKSLSHKKDEEALDAPAPATLLLDSDDSSTEEVIWFPKTTSRSAAMKWSMMRQGGGVGTPHGRMGKFIYGSIGKNGVEYY